MAELDVRTDAAELGFDPDRLDRVGDHFGRYVDDGRLAGYQVVVTRRGQVAYATCRGYRDREAGLPVDVDTRWRIFSMTKPVTAVAAMMLYERGAFELTDPIARYLPEFADVAVYAAGSPSTLVCEPATEPIRVWHLLTHTAGLTYGFHRVHPVDALYREAGFDLTTPPGRTLADCCATLACLPLLFEPGTAWHYSMASDVLGRLLEVLSGQSLDDFLTEHIFAPLGMVDTGFWVPEHEMGMLAALYVSDPATGRAVRDDVLGQIGTRRPDCLSGGGGLVSTAADYHRFTQMLMRGGELDGNRVLGPCTVEFMTRNHLPGDAEIREIGRPGFTEALAHGVGYGLGVSVLLDPVRAKTLGNPGEYAWGGAASTAFWIDPVEDITALFFTQLVPSTAHPIRSRLRQLVYQALDRSSDPLPGSTR